MAGFLEAKMRKAGHAAGKSGKDLDHYIKSPNKSSEPDSDDFPMMPSTRSRRHKKKDNDSDDKMGKSPWGY